MDVERALISKIISTGNLEDVVARGISADLFVDEECRGMFEWFMNHYRRFRKAPSGMTVRKEKREWEQEHVDEPIEYLIDSFVTLVKRRYAQDMAVEIAEACDDPERASRIEMEWMEVGRKLVSIVPSTPVSKFSDMGRRIDDYERRVKEGERPGIPFGFPTLDAWTGGIKPHQLVTVAGFTGTGKSTLLRIIALNAWLVGKTPLYFSLEETKEEIYERMDAVAASVDYTRMRHLDLGEEEIENWREYAKRIETAAHDIQVIECGRSTTPDTVYAEMIRHEPDLVVIDYMSLLKSSSPTTRGTSMWQSLTEITQDLKQIARTLKIPILAAAQTNRTGGKEGAELDNIGYSLSVNQDSDIVIGLFADDEMKERKEMEIRLNKNRRGRLGKIRAIWNHDEMIFREKEYEDRFGKRGEK